VIQRSKNLIRVVSPQMDKTIVVAAERLVSMPFTSNESVGSTRPMTSKCLQGGDKVYIESRRSRGSAGAAGILVSKIIRPRE